VGRSQVLKEIIINLPKTLTMANFSSIADVYALIDDKKETIKIHDNRP
jgi:hypothetical protein